MLAGDTGGSIEEAGVKVREIWELALPPGTTLAGGEASLGRIVEWVAALRAVFPLFGTLGEGYLALARLGLARRLDPTLTTSYLLNELHRAHASAFVVDEPVSEADAALANQLALPLLVLPGGADLHEIEREILRTLIDREAQITRREQEARQRLQQILGQQGIQGVINELAHLTAGHVLVRDKSSVPIARAGERPLVNDVMETAFPIKVAERVLGQLILSTRPVRSPLETLYARQAAEICGLEMLQKLAREETEDRLGADLVERLLDKTQEEAAASRLQRLGYDLSANRWHVAVALGGSTSAKKDDKAVDDVSQAVARDLQWAAQRDGAGVLIVRYREQILALCSFAVTSPERTMRNWVQEATTRGSAQRCHVGVSRIVRGLAGLRQAVSQALDALSLGQRIHGRKSPHYYEELGLYRLLSGLRAQDELQRFYDETLGLLARYDEAHGTELVNTLEMFFDQNANASQTSRALFIHRNTLNYRLQRIGEITGLDLNDAEARLAMQLALKLHRLSAG